MGLWCCTCPRREKAGGVVVEGQMIYKVGKGGRVQQGGWIQVRLIDHEQGSDL